MKEMGKRHLLPGVPEGRVMSPRPPRQLGPSWEAVDIWDICFKTYQNLHSMIFDLRWFSGFVREAKEKRSFCLWKKVYCYIDGKMPDGRCGKKQNEPAPRKNLWSANNTGEFRIPLLPDLGWEVISHKRGGGKREIKVHTCYSPSLKRHHFSESTSSISWKSPAPAGSFSTALWNCLTVLSFVTHSSGRAVLLYLCTMVPSSSRIWVLHSRTLCSLPPNGAIDCSRQGPPPRDAPAYIQTSQMPLVFIHPKAPCPLHIPFSLFLPSTCTYAIIKKIARVHTPHFSFHWGTTGEDKECRNRGSHLNSCLLATTNS